MKLLASIAAVVLLLCLLLLALPFSAAGTRVLAHAVNGTGLLQVEYGSGSLFGELGLQRVALELDSIELVLEDVNTRLDIDCFWRSAFCFDTLRVQSLRLDVAEGGGQADPEPPALIEIPFIYRASNLQVAQLRVGWPGGHWQQENLVADLQLANSVLEVYSAHIASPVLFIAADASSDAGYQGFEPPPIFMPLGLHVDSLQITAARFQLGEQTTQIDRLSLAGSWRQYELQLSELAAGSEALGEAAVEGEVQFAANWSFSLDGEATLADTGGELLARRRLRTTLQGDLQQLLLEVTAAGEPALALELQANVMAAGLPLEGGASAQWPDGTSLGQIMASDGPLDSVVLNGPATAGFEGTLDSLQFNIATAASGLGYQQLQLQAAGKVAGTGLELGSLELVDGNSQSRLLATGKLDWGQGWNLVAAVESPGLALPDLGGGSAGRLAGSLQLLLEGAGDSWSLRWQALDISGDYRGLPAVARGDGGIDSQLQLLPGTTELGANGAELKVLAERGQGAARLEFQLDDLGRWIAGAQGQIEMDGSGTLGREQLQLRGRADNIRVNGVDLGRVNLALEYAGKEQRLAASVRAPAISSSGYQMRNVQLTLDGSFASHRLQLASAGDISGTLDVTGSWNSGQWSGSLAPSRLATGSGDWVLPEAVGLEWLSGASQLSIAGHCWRHPEFTLCAEPITAGGSGKLHLDLAGNVRAFNGLLPRGFRVGGQLDARLDVAWQPGQRMQLDARIDGRNMRATRHYGMGERVSVDWQAMELVLARQDDDSLAVSGFITRDNLRVLTVDGTLPASAAGEMQARIALDSLQLSMLSPWVTELAELAGSLSGELLLTGTPQVPLATGNLRLRDGRMVAVANPTVLSELALDLRLDGEQADLAGSASLGDGAISMQGKVTREPLLQVQLTVSGGRHLILLPPASEVLVSEKLALSLDGKVLDVQGEVQVHEGVLRHAELPAGSVGLSREVVVVDTLGNVITEEDPFDLSADIWVRIRDRFQVEGEGLRATLGGDLHVVAAPGEDPQVFGNLNLIGGELEAYRQRLQIRNGTIAFSGPVDNPALDVTAERDIRADNVTVGARLQGPLNEPVLEVYSDPVMSQSEAMSYLVRGRGLDAGAGADGTALALSMGASVVNRSGIVDGLNRLPLISDVAFGASGEQDDTAATVSGYIGNRLYLSFGRGLYQPLNVLTARLYLQSRLWLEVVSELENSADLYYSFDID
ncbi:hypothetical protein DWB85_05295 [Seongchinamella sediminis]|uniref:Translocation and assembly module TamB C-terminal domain-containing protein n=1 Tax=Seongchinamella sediminis TaxID=2283635 RepID=A0A3L7E392_9GAMM|nr:translocation/assembly module TamB domain-containing protein [Seongchinamella sediminis]RLQ22861.1 hypothetical protein DWB85_05295 [Seongchinamella sediminis]